MVVELMLECGHLIIVPVESILLVPQVGDEIRCSNCKVEKKVKKVGTPYRVEQTVVNNTGNKSILGE